MQEQVLVTLPVNDEQRKEFERVIEEAGHTVAFVTTNELRQQDVDAASIIVGYVPVGLLHASSSLAWMQTSTAGYDHLLAPGVLDKSTRLTNATGAYGQAVSEHMLAQLLCLMKKLHLYRDNQAQAVWADEGPVTSLVGAQVLVLGAGDVGTAFARLTHALGAHVTGMRRTHTTAQCPFERMITPSDLFNVLPHADVVASVLPSSPQTQGLADDKFFQAMKPGAYFLNAGRGDLVNTDALCQSLASGHLAGAALDVTDPEPLPANHPLWHEERVLITPHIAGWWHLQATLDNVVRICLNNLRAYFVGEPLANEVPRG